MELHSDHMDQVSLIDNQKWRFQEFLLPVELRIEIRRYLLVGCYNSRSVRDLIVTFPPEEVEDFSERLFGHQVEMTKQLKHPLEILTASLSKVGVFIFSKKISNVSKIGMEGDSEHKCRKNSVLYRQSTIDYFPVI